MSHGWKLAKSKKIFLLRKVKKKKETNGAKGGEGSRNIFAVKCFMANMRHRTRNTTGVQERLPIVYGNYTSLSQLI